jgi:tyrosine-protein kinase Etk/Wzc
MTSIDPEEKFFSPSDLAWLFRKKKQTLWRISLLFSIAAAIAVFFMSPFYKIEATFKESSEYKEPQGLLKDLVSNMGWPAGAPQANALMKSSQVIKPLISRLGLQARIAENGVFRRVLIIVCDTFRAELGCHLADRDTFRFSSLVYEGEKPLNCSIRFLDRNRFQIRRHQSSVEGCIGEMVKIGNLSFSIMHLSKNLKIGIDYRLTISPWMDIAIDLRKNLRIAALKTNQSIYHLSLLTRDRFLGTEILNGLMHEYQNYLKRDHDQVAHLQLAYLEERQDHLFDKLRRDYDEHARYLQKNVGDRGFIRADQETAALLKPYRELFSKSFSLDLEMDRLSACPQNPVHSLVGVATPIGETIHQLRQSVQQLEGQRDLLAASLYFQPSVSRRCVAQDRDELQKVRCDLETAERALQEIENRRIDALSLELFHDPDRILQSWAEQINKEGDEPKDLIAYLNSLVRLFSVQEKILLERQVHPLSQSSELFGIDLDMARQLLIQASQNLDGSKASIEHYRHLLSQIDNPSFELSSLSAALRDPASQRFLSQAADLHWEMEDESHHSEKEVHRIQGESSLQRKVLKGHLEQMIVVEQLNSSIYQDKIAALQQISLDCINRQISVENEQIVSLVQQRKESLLREKQILASKMQELRSKMNELPGKWREENLLKLKTELGVKVMLSVAQFVESKTIGQNLHHVESKPLDLAVPPRLPERPYLFVFLLAGGCIGLTMSFLYFFFKALYRGFPASWRMLQSLHYPYVGSISFHADGSDMDHLPDRDLESLRKLLVKIDSAPQRKRIGLFAGQGPDYSHSLAHLLAQSGRKVLLLSCDFSTNSSQEDFPGLVQAISGSAPALPIRRCQDYDFLPSGGYSRFGAELIRSATFADLIERLTPAYDHILLFSRSELDSAQCESLLRVNQAAIVTIVEEPIELLTPFIQWAYDEGQCRLMFLTASC